MYFAQAATEAGVRSIVNMSQISARRDAGSDAARHHWLCERLLDRTGEFTAEVPTSATGHFRFFANTGRWTLRTLAPRAEVVDKAVDAEVGRVAEVTIAL